MTFSILTRVSDVFYAIDQLNMKDINIDAKISGNGATVRVERLCENDTVIIVLAIDETLSIKTESEKLFGINMNCQEIKRDQLVPLIMSVFTETCPWKEFIYLMRHLDMSWYEKCELATLMLYRDPNVGTKEYFRNTLYIKGNVLIISPAGREGYLIQTSDQRNIVAKNNRDLVRIITEGEYIK